MPPNAAARAVGYTSSPMPMRSLLALLLPALLLAACGGSDAAPPEPGAPPIVKRELLVFAASSLTDAFTEAGKTFETQHPGVSVVLNLAATSTLRLQVEQGARADVFASADQRNLDLLAQAGLTDGASVPFASNRLAVIVPRKNAKVATLADLGKPGLRLVLVTPQAPIGAYVGQVLDLVARDPAYGPAFVQRLRQSVVTEALNVRQAVATVQLGEADATLVYSTDAVGTVAQDVAAIFLPDAFHVPVSYLISVVKGAPQPALAREFVAFIAGPEGQRVLKAWGFLAP